MVYTYNANDYPLFSTAVRFAHTVWPAVLSSYSFWVFLIVHVLLWFSFRLKLLDNLSAEDGLHVQLAKGIMEVKWHDIQVISTITTFFEVFYTQECYRSYLNLNAEVNQVFRKCHKIVFENKQILCPLDAPGQVHHLRLTSRWIQAQLILFLVEIRHGPLREGHWEQIREIGLLTSDECAFLESFSDSQRPFVILNWVAQLSISGLNKSNFKMNEKHLMDVLMDFDEAQKRVLDIIRMPCPFEYFHILNLMVMITSTLWCYAMAMTESICGPVVFVFALSIFIGMLELAKMFSDPFGDDDVDFPIHIWAQKFLSNQLAYIECNFPGAKDGFQAALAKEERLDWELDAIGALIDKEIGHSDGPINVSNRSRHKPHINAMASDAHHYTLVGTDCRTEERFWPLEVHRQ